MGSTQLSLRENMPGFHIHTDGMRKAIAGISDL